MGLVDDLLKGRDVRRVENPGPGWGRDVYVRRLSTTAISAIKEQPDTEAGNLDRMVIAVQDSACDSSGSPLFANGDEVGRLPLDMIEPVAMEAIYFGGEPEDAEGE